MPRLSPVSDPALLLHRRRQLLKVLEVEGCCDPAECVDAAWCRYCAAVALLRLLDRALLEQVRREAS